MKETSLVESLRIIQLEWELPLDKISALSHVSESVLAGFLETPSPQAQQLPTVPVGLENSVPLIAIFRKLKAKFPNTEDQLKWLFTEHKDFGNNKPIDVIAQSPEDLAWVAYYLESSKR